MTHEQTHDRSSWQVRDTAVLRELAGLMNLSPEEQQLLGGLQQQAEAVAPRLAAAFYDRLMQHENTAEYFMGSRMADLHATLHTWFVELFGGVYDENYAQRRIRIGEVHVHAGIPVRYPLAMLDLIMQYGVEVTQQSAQPAAARVAFDKVLALDVAIFNQAYENNQLQHLASMVGSEVLARRLLGGAG